MEGTYGVDVLRDVPVVRLSGDIDIRSAPVVRAGIEQVLDDGAEFVVVDLADVTFFDSSGLKVVDDVQRQAHARGARIAVVCPQQRVLRLFEIAGIDDQFAFHASARDAAESAQNDD